MCMCKVFTTFSTKRRVDFFLPFTVCFDLLDLLIAAFLFLPTFCHYFSIRGVWSCLFPFHESLRAECVLIDMSWKVGMCVEMVWPHPKKRGQFIIETLSAALLGLCQILNLIQPSGLWRSNEYIILYYIIIKYIYFLLKEALNQMRQERTSLCVIHKLKKLSFKPADLEAVLSSNSAIKQTLGPHLSENFRREFSRSVIL
jgi:hypothetical protein